MPAERTACLVEAVNSNLFMKKFNDLVDQEVKQALRDDHKIRQLVAQIMPPESLSHVQFCRIENRVLKITLDNASWLARLRFISRQLIDELSRAGITVVDITWHVAPEKNTVEPRPIATRSRARSKASANILRATAESMEADDLQRALLKVAKQMNKEKEK